MEFGGSWVNWNLNGNLSSKIIIAGASKTAVFILLPYLLLMLLTYAVKPLIIIMTMKINNNKKMRTQGFRRWKVRTYGRLFIEL